MSTSQEAYNGCLSLFSREERQQRGDIHLFISLSSTKRLFAPGRYHEWKEYQQSHGSQAMGKGFGAYLHELKKKFENSQNSDQLPRPNVESVNDIIATTSDEIEFFSSPIIENSKILVVEDPRSFHSLRESFQQFPSEFVTQIWMMQETWGACYDILSSLRASGHHSITLTFIFDPISDPSSWPTLQAAYPRGIHSISRTRSNSNRSILLLRHSDAESHQQDVISLSNSSLSGFSWHVCSEKEDDTTSMTSEASWEILHEEEDEEHHNNSPTRSYSEHSYEVMVTQSPSPMVPPKSYRDALLAQAVELPHIPTSNCEAPANFCQLTRIFPKNLESPPEATEAEEMWQFDDLVYESDTYVDWLETSYGSKETSIAAITRARVHSAKISHERKKKSSNNYHRKHAR
jgi:hypothetical protein